MANQDKVANETDCVIWKIKIEMWKNEQKLQNNREYGAQ